MLGGKINHPALYHSFSLPSILLDAQVVRGVQDLLQEVFLRVRKVFSQKRFLKEVLRISGVEDLSALLHNLNVFLKQKLSKRVLVTLFLAEVSFECLRLQQRLTL